MAYTYKDTVQQGYASAPLWVDDETGQEFLDVDGLLGPPPERPTGFDPMQNALAQGSGARAAERWQDATGGQMTPMAREQYGMPPESTTDTPVRMGTVLPPEPIPGLDTDLEPEPQTPQAPSNPYLDKLQQIASAPPRRTYTAPREAGWDPQSMTTGMTPEDMGEMQKQINQVGQLRLDAADAEYQSRYQLAQQEAIVRAEQNQRRAEELRAKQMMVDAREKAIEAEHAKTMARVEDVRKKKIDPDRIHKERGVGGTILAAIAAGMGQYGAAMTGGPNIAAQILENQVQNDIAAQEENLANEREDADNMLGELRREYGTVDEAKKVLAMMQRQYQLDVGDSLVQGKEGSMLDIEWQKNRAEILAKNLEDSMALRKAAEMRVSSKWQDARRGGYSEVDPLAQLERIDKAGKTLTSIKGNTEQLAGTQGDPKMEQRITEYGKTVAPLDLVASAVSDLDTMVSEGRARGDVPGVGIWDSNKPDFLDSKEGLRVKAKFNVALEGLAKAITGAAFSEEQEERYANALGDIRKSLATEEGVQVGLNSMKEVIRDMRAAAAATHGGPDTQRVVDEYARRKSTTHVPGDGFDTQPMQGRDYTGPSRAQRLFGSD